MKWIINKYSKKNNQELIKIYFSKKNEKEKKYILDILTNKKNKLDISEINRFLKDEFAFTYYKDRLYNMLLNSNDYKEMLNVFNDIKDNELYIKKLKNKVYSSLNSEYIIKLFELLYSDSLNKNRKILMNLVNETENILIKIGDIDKLCEFTKINNCSWYSKQIRNYIFESKEYNKIYKFLQIAKVFLENILSISNDDKIIKEIQQELIYFENKLISFNDKVCIEKFYVLYKDLFEKLNLFIEKQHLDEYLKDGLAKNVLTKEIDNKIIYRSMYKNEEHENYKIAQIVYYDFLNNKNCYYGPKYLDNLYYECVNKNSEYIIHFFDMPLEQIEFLLQTLKDKNTFYTLKTIYQIKKKMLDYEKKEEKIEKIEKLKKLEKKV